MLIQVNMFFPPFSTVQNKIIKNTCWELFCMALFEGSNIETWSKSYEIKTISESVLILKFKSIHGDHSVFNFALSCNNSEHMEHYGVCTKHQFYGDLSNFPYDRIVNIHTPFLVQNGENEVINYVSSARWFTTIYGRTKPQDQLEIGLH